MAINTTAPQLLTIKLLIDPDSHAENFPDIATAELFISASMSMAGQRAANLISDSELMTEVIFHLSEKNVRYLTAAGQEVKDYIIPSRLIYSLDRLRLVGLVIAEGEREWGFCSRAIDFQGSTILDSSEETTDDA